MIDELELIGRVALAAALGCAIGFERESRRKAAGLRTHALVAMGAAVFTVAGAEGFRGSPGVDLGDPARVAAQVATGIGFIGAGAILRTGATVRGLTTAATLWLAAALGVAAGAGLYLTSVGAGIAVLVVVVGLGSLKPALVRPRLRVVTVDYQGGHGTLGPVLRHLEEVVGEVRGVRLSDDPDGTRRARIEVRSTDDRGLDEVVREAASRAEVHRAEWTIAPPGGG